MYVRNQEEKPNKQMNKLVKNKMMRIRHTNGSGFDNLNTNDKLLTRIIQK